MLVEVNETLSAATTVSRIRRGRRDDPGPVRLLQASTDIDELAAAADAEGCRGLECGGTPGALRQSSGMAT